MLQALPRMKDLSRVKLLDPSLRAVGQAVFYGLIPGLIRSHGQSEMSSPSGDESRYLAIEAYNNEAGMGDADETFQSLVGSIILSNRIWNVPKPLQTFLELGLDDYYQGIVGRWTPYHLEFVLRNALVTEGSWLAPIKTEMANLCERLKTADQVSDDGYKSLFALMVLIRSVSDLYCGDILPSLRTYPVKVLYNPFNETVAGTVLENCESWEQLRRGIQGFDVGKGASIALVYPKRPFFGRYDMIAVYMKDQWIEMSNGFQLDAFQATPSLPAVEGIFSFFLSGAPPDEDEESLGWYVTSGSNIDKFYSGSGQFWTPQEWKRLYDSLHQS
jgi:hypothetical protein